MQKDQKETNITIAELLGSFDFKILECDEINSLLDVKTFEETVKTPEEMKDLIVSAAALSRNKFYVQFQDYVLSYLANAALKFGNQENIKGLQQAAALFIWFSKEARRIGSQDQVDDTQTS